MDTRQVLLCTEQFLADHGRRLDETAPGLEVVALDPSHGVAELDRPRITMAYMSKDTFPQHSQSFLEAAATLSNLQWLHVWASGLDSPAFDPFRDRGVRVTRTAGASAHAMAETVFMYLHTLGRDRARALDDRRRRRFDWYEWRQLEGRRLAVLGFGAVGRRVVELAMAYGMEPTVVRRRARGDEPCATRPLSDLHLVLPEAEVVVVALPLTDRTEGLISAELIGRMSPGTIVVNVSRGAIIDQRALTDALSSGHLGGAGLDVFTTEPLPRDDPLWDLPNVVITPHNSGSSEGSRRRVVDIFLASLRSYLDARETGDH